MSNATSNKEILEAMSKKELQIISTRLGFGQIHNAFGGEPNKKDYAYMLNRLLNVNPEKTIDPYIITREDESKFVAGKVYRGDISGDTYTIISRTAKTVTVVENNSQYTYPTKCQILKQKKTEYIAYCGDLIYSFNEDKEAQAILLKPKKEATIKFEVGRTYHSENYWDGEYHHAYYTVISRSDKTVTLIEACQLEAKNITLDATTGKRIYNNDLNKPARRNIHISDGIETVYLDCLYTFHANDYIDPNAKAKEFGDDINETLEAEYNEVQESATITAPAEMPALPAIDAEYQEVQEVETAEAGEKLTAEISTQETAANDTNSANIEAVNFFNVSANDVKENSDDDDGNEPFSSKHITVIADDKTVDFLTYEQAIDELKNAYLGKRRPYDSDPRFSVSPIETIFKILNDCSPDTLKRIYDSENIYSSYTPGTGAMMKTEYIPREMSRLDFVRWIDRDLCDRLDFIVRRGYALHNTDVESAWVQNQKRPDEPEQPKILKLHAIHVRPVEELSPADFGFSKRKKFSEQELYKLESNRTNDLIDKNCATLNYSKSLDSEEKIKSLLRDCDDETLTSILIIGYDGTTYKLDPTEKVPEWRKNRITINSKTIKKTREEIIHDIYIGVKKFREKNLPFLGKIRDAETYEAPYFDEEYFSDIRADNSHPEQDIPEAHEPDAIPVKCPVLHSLVSAGTYYKEFCRENKKLLDACKTKAEFKALLLTFKSGTSLLRQAEYDRVYLSGITMRERFSDGMTDAEFKENRAEIYATKIFERRERKAREAQKKVKNSPAPSVHTPTKTEGRQISFVFPGQNFTFDFAI